MENFSKLISDLVLYSIIIHVGTVVIFVLWWVYFGHRFIDYTMNHHPLKAKEFLRLHILTLIPALFKSNDIDDPVFSKKKMVARNAFIAMCCVYLIGHMVLVSFVIFYAMLQRFNVPK